MATIFKSDGVDLDDIFEPRNGITPARSVVYVTNGQNLSDRYAPLSAGSAADPVVFNDGADNLSDLYAAIGTVNLWPDPPVWAGFWRVDGLALGGGAVATIRPRFKTNGDFEIERVFTTTAGSDITDIMFGPVRFIPDNLTAGEVEVLCEVLSGDPLTVNQLSSYTAISANRVVEQQSSSPPNELRQTVVRFTAREIANPSNSSTGEATLTTEAITED